MLKVTPYLELDSEAKHLVDQTSGETIDLTFSESAVLTYLLSVPDVICGKEVLLEQGWPDRVVAATSLTQCISTLRKKLEPYPEVQLKTIARRGYQVHVSARPDTEVPQVKDSESITKARFHVSLVVKITGVLMLLLITGICWFNSDHYSVIEETNKWNSDRDIPLNIGGTIGSAQLIYPDGVNQLHPSMWQKHIAPESNSIKGIDNFNAFALTDGNHYSFAVCPNGELGACPAEQLINITSIDLKPAGLNMSQFMALTDKMESRIRYNRILIPNNEVFNEEAGGTELVPELIEHHYHGDVYFPVAKELLVRADLSVSMVYEGDDTGKFYSSTCITDEDCLTTPIKYKIRGQFKQYKQTINNMAVDVFKVDVSQKDLIKPDAVSSSAMHFYREIRKHNIRDEELYYYRIYKDETTAVWIVPLMGNIVAWTKYEKVEL
ncbi:transcriptional regulatory protein [Shewanella psychrophila]|uniref:Transcriptional regulatory protein n=1 Tax=Shewanella psychrophila TaxID=225848 RepID=A0A1S6HS85_9GAMM|nr:helix-turn-helix domain-containing protein [Shewanella psychrophila]AQS38344.1 transcriptional regulatory protein [Shewanella psychrophila]